MSLDVERIDAGLNHLRVVDPVMRRLIADVGPFRLRLERNRFRSLVRSIISQQISGSAAQAIRRRLEGILGPRKMTADNLARMTSNQLRQAGLSSQKSSYLLDLSEKVLQGQVRLRRLARLSDEEIIQELVQVKGIGVWTAQMFLIFSMGRLDVFPHADLGIRSALRRLYQLDDLPNHATSHEIARSWRPFATLASWYCWRSLDLEKNQRRIPCE
jgi:DNA-3-methyladenine glycosylase II